MGMISQLLWSYIKSKEDVVLPALVESLWKALNWGETSISRKEVRDTRGKATVIGTRQEDQADGTGT